MAANPDFSLLKEDGAAWSVIGDDTRRAWTSLRREMEAFAAEIR